MVIATKAGFVIRNGERIVDTSRRALLRDLDGSLDRLGTDYVDLWQMHAFGEAPLAETLAAVDHAVSSRPGALRRGVQLRRLADRAGGDLAERLSGAYADQQRAGGVLAAGPAGRGRGAAGASRRSGWACSRGRRWAAAC